MNLTNHPRKPHRCPNGTKRKGAKLRTLLKPTDARYRIWQSMRVLRRFTIGHLAAVSTAKADNVKRYVRALARHDYARCVQQATPARGSAGRAVWTLIKDTGPHAPRACSDGTIFDPNLLEPLSALRPRKGAKS
jgi:hypothetical protein